MPNERVVVQYSSVMSTDTWNRLGEIVSVDWTKPYPICVKWINPSGETWHLASDIVILKNNQRIPVTIDNIP